MPGVWNETIDMHRREVREAIMLAGATLVSEHGLRSVTMSQIAERAGIGRATLYKYFPSVEAILLAWHERQVAGHVQQLTAIAEEAGADSPRQRLEAVLEAYALIAQEYQGTDVAAAVHHGDHVVLAEHQLRRLIRDRLGEAAAAGEVRTDIPPEELTTYCLHALSAAGRATTPEAVRRLVQVILDGLRPRV